MTVEGKNSYLSFLDYFFNFVFATWSEAIEESIQIWIAAGYALAMTSY